MLLMVEVLILRESVMMRMLPGVWQQEDTTLICRRLCDSGRSSGGGGRRVSCGCGGSSGGGGDALNPISLRFSGGGVEQILCLLQCRQPKHKLFLRVRVGDFNP